MELALYDPVVGYYNRDVAGPGAAADYLTSPEIHSGFAALLCRQFFEMWQYLGRPKDFWLVEMGAGSGVFLADVLATANAVFPDLASALNVAVIEPSPSLRLRQAALLAPYGDRVRWLDSSPPWPILGAGCVFANEVLDALPVHRVVGGDGDVVERYVDWDGAEFRDVLAAPSTPALADQIATGGAHLANGHAGEVSIAVPRLVTSLASLVDPGYVVLLDYGEPALTLYRGRYPAGTLRCYWRHTRNRDPYRRVGEQDITSHVDLTAVTRACDAVGLNLLGATRQTRLLRRLGVEAVVETITGAGASRSEMRAHLAALSLLVDPRELGALTAVAFGKEAPAHPLTGFSDQTNSPVDVPIRLLALRSDPAQLARTASRRVWEVGEPAS
jgi:SAM-dependent MidA family methyltransferase